ncbi:MAG: DMT family transporter [Sphingobacteriaceae bacterium]|nr:DMT family transporter [Cytophagaceae bacterium]
MNSPWFLLLLAVLIGAILPVQAGLNAQLARVAGNPVWSALISFGTGTLGLIAYLLVNRVGLTTVTALRAAPWYLYLGGLLGAVYVTMILLLVSRLGVALTFGLTIAGQMLLSLVLDHFGLLGLPMQPVSAGRLAGVALLVVGVILIRRY